MTKILILSDFDETIVRPDLAKVLGEFYQSLFRDYKNGQIQRDHKRAPLKTSEEIQAIFKAKFGHLKEAESPISPSAVAFFKNALANIETGVYIITKTRPEFVQELFKYYEFSEDELVRLVIFAENDTKETKVNSILDRYKLDPKRVVYIFDAIQKDANDMANAAMARGYLQEHIKKHHEKPKQFHWDHYVKEIQDLCELDKRRIMEPKIAETAVKIDKILEQLRTQIGKIDQHHFSEAYLAAELLLNELAEAKGNYFTKLNEYAPQTIQDANAQFKQDCQAAVDKARPVLEKDLNWEDYLCNLLKAVANAVIYMLNTVSSYSFFSYTTAASMGVAETTLEDLNNNVLSFPV